MPLDWEPDQCMCDHTYHHAGLSELRLYCKRHITWRLGMETPRSLLGCGVRMKVPKANSLCMLVQAFQYDTASMGWHMGDGLLAISVQEGEPTAASICPLPIKLRLNWIRC